MEPSKSEKKSHWSISDFYNKSWDLTWNNKKLWILGLAVSLYAGGGSSGNSSFDSSELQQLQNNQQQEQQLPESPYNELDIVEDAGAHNGEVHSVEAEAWEAIETKDGTDAVDIIRAVETTRAPFNEGLKNVPLHVWGLIGLEFLILIVGVIILGFFLVSWSTGALIQGVAQAAAKKKIDLFTISSYAITKAKPLIWISVIPFLRFILKAIFIGIAGAIALAFLVNIVEGLSFLGVIVGIVAVCWFSYLLIRLGTAITYAAYYCIEEDLDGKDAFDKAYVVVKGNLMKSIRLSFANAIMAGIIMFAVILPVLGVGFGTVMGDLMNNSFTPMTFVPVGITLLLTMPVMTLVQGILKVFTYSTWHYAYQALKHDV